MYWLIHWIFKITGFIPWLFGYRTKVYYEDKSVQGRRIRGKAIVMSNHHSVMDVALNMFVFWGRTLRCLVAELMYEKNIFMTLVLKLLGGIKVDRNTHDFSFLGKAERVLNKNGVIEIYPEARLANKGEEKPLEFKPSVVYLALSTGAPIIPVYHNGALFKKERARVIIGKPIDVKDWYDDGLLEKENIDMICKKLRERVIELGYELERQREKEKAK